MTYYSYVIPRDYGFAPNPYFGYCTLATCKPVVRRVAQVGDWIAAYGSAVHQLNGMLVFLMRIQETLTFDEYWQDSRFRCKRPVFNKSVTYMYGDNIYHHVNGNWVQEPSHHSLPDRINYNNLNRDTRTNRVLIAEEFYYFGDCAIHVPSEFMALVWHGRNHGAIRNDEYISNFVCYIRQNYSIGIHGLPYSRKPGKFTLYSG